MEMDKLQISLCVALNKSCILNVKPVMATPSQTQTQGSYGTHLLAFGPICSWTYMKNQAELPTAIWNCSGTRSNGAWMLPGLPNWPQAAIWSSPLLSRKNTAHPAAANVFRNSIILSSLVGLKNDPLCGLNEMRLILQGMPFTSPISLFASSSLHKRLRQKTTLSMKIQ